MNKKNKLLLLLGTIFFVILLIIFNKSQKKENEFFISKDINRYESRSRILCVVGVSQGLRSSDGDV